MEKWEKFEKPDQEEEIEKNKEGMEIENSEEDRESKLKKFIKIAAALFVSTGPAPWGNEVQYGAADILRKYDKKHDHDKEKRDKRKNRGK